MSCTCSNEEHVVGPLHALDLVHGDLCVAHTALQQQGSTADHAVHQEMVLDKVEHFIRHVQGRLDAHLPGVVGHALWGSKLKMKNEPLLIRVDLQIQTYDQNECSTMALVLLMKSVKFEVRDHWKQRKNKVAF